VKIYTENMWRTMECCYHTSKA